MATEAQIATMRAAARRNVRKMMSDMFDNIGATEQARTRFGREIGEVEEQLVILAVDVYRASR